MTTLASDTFTRANNASNFGTASDGNSYTYAGTTGVESISSNEGVINSGSGGTDALALIGSGTAATVNILCRLAAADSVNAPGVVARYANINNYYRAGINNQNVVIDKFVGGAFTGSIGTAAFTYSANQYCWIRFVLVGTSLKVTIWLDGNSEPGSPTISITDSSLSAAGQYGVFAYQGNNNANHFDHLTITDNSSGVTHLRIMDGYGGVFS